MVLAQHPSRIPLAHDVTSLVGNTPLIRLKRVVEDFAPGVEVYGKAEYFNPGGSVKDRPGLNMILQGERSGQLTPGKIILDATSGNTGIAYAWIAAAKGYRVKLALPANASEERKRILNAYGVELVLTDPALSSDGAILKARELYTQNPDLYFYPDQYSNPHNWRAHYLTTGPEIYEQTQGRVTHFVAGLGTSGTCMGVGTRLKEHNPQIEILAMQPDSPFHGLEGLKHMATALVPAIYDPHVPTQQVEVSTEDAQRMVKRLAREEGLLVGISAGANVVAALRVAQTLTAGVVVTIFCDSADKYLSERFWDEA
ncbi:PLP-dependent cysteine synthase family protein [Candidatus Cyanaurora vandensis]|uniref:PLP-dependent cysteine synthase family protein n=1 Tax=Candidatus Cyanaurora vandensis TaxID=2714958 RepID=UPI00257DAF3A|nr:cysteine synthase family protein [Candidatus Cyanaurora vandensis]